MNGNSIAAPRILVIGSTGQVGFELCSTLQTLGNVTAVDLSTEPLAVDFANPAAIRRLVQGLAPDVVVNAAAYTAVDKAETQTELAQAVNAIAPQILAEEASRLNAIVVHYSTDYVYDGTSSTPYKEDTIGNPLSVYGRTKLAGDCAVAAAAEKWFVLRTSWVYGNRGQNFLLTMQRLANEGKALRVVNDQIGAPTWSRFLAVATAQLLDRLLSGAVDAKAASGIYHLTASGSTSWYEFARSIMTLSLPQDHPALVGLTPIPTADYPTPATRPRQSLLDCSKIATTFGIVCPDWYEMLRLCIANGINNNKT